MIDSVASTYLNLFQAWEFYLNKMDNKKLERCLLSAVIYVTGWCMKQKYLLTSYNLILRQMQVLLNHTERDK